MTVDILVTIGHQVCEDLMDQRPADYGGMKTYLKKTYDRVERYEIVYFAEIVENKLSHALPFAFRLKKADEDRLRADLEMMDGH